MDAIEENKVSRQPSAKERLLKRLNEMKEDKNFHQTEIPKADRSKPLALSYAQQRLWFLNQYEGGVDSSYNIWWALRLQGPLNIAALKYAFKAIFQRHEILRTTIQAVNGEIVQSINDDALLDIEIIDIDKNKIEKYAKESADYIFDLSTGPLINVSLLRLSEHENILLINMHHIVSDGWSVGVMNRELATLYTAYSKGEKSSLPELPIQYVDFAGWQRQWLQGKILNQQISYWKEQLDGAPALLELPSDRPRPARQSYQGRCYTFIFPATLLQKIQALSQSEHATLYMTLLSAFNILLARYSGQSDICVGSPIANRQRPELEGLIGFFVNTLIIRTQIKGGESFKDVVQRVKSTTLAAYKHQDIPFEHLVEALKPERSLSHSPLFQVMFVLQNAGSDSLELPGITVSDIDCEADTARFDILMSLRETDGGLEGVLEYNTDLFDLTTIKRFVDHYKILLEGIVKDPEEDIFSLSLLTQSEYQQQLIQWNNTNATYPHRQSIVELFEIQAAETPNAVAVIYYKQTLSYSELNGLSNQLANYLVLQNVGMNVRVGLCVERSINMLIGLLGILKAGGAYVPLDSNYPKERLAYMLEHAEVDLLLTQNSLTDRLPFHDSILELDNNDSWRSNSRAANKNLQLPISPENLAYVIYTSGSTGKPKAVAMPHRALVNLIQWQLNNTLCAEESKTLQFSPISFDVSFQEIFSTWSSGGALVLISDELRKDPFLLWRFLIEAEINRLFMPFIALQQLAEAYHAEGSELIPFTLKEVITAGEQLQITPFIRNLFEALPQCTLHNHYGPSESHVVTVLDLEGPPDNWEFLPTIGKPIANNYIYILDQTLRPVPVGVYGEIHIGGIGLAHGYLGREELTAERFIDNPFIPSERLYKTGDLARYRPDGNIEYKGRADGQTKIRGFRIEPGEIEHALTDQEGVKEAVVMVRARGQGAKDKYLVAYIVPEDGVALDQQVLTLALKSVLPDYMVPSVFMFLEVLPLAPSGKVDRKSLPEPEDSIVQFTEYIAPSSEIEKKLTTIWGQVLNIPKETIGTANNFFDLGGHSISVIQVVSLCKQDGINFTVKDMFERQSIGQLAACLYDKEELVGEVINLQSEIKLDDTINRNNLDPACIENAKTVFLTGATGFVGAFLLKELLDRSEMTVYCLVRADTVEKAEERVSNKLKEYNLYDECDIQRVIPVLGDLSQPLLGLNAADFNDLSERVDVIIHNGAWVNHVYSYELLKAANIGGTHEVLKLASHKKLKAVHHISTLATAYLDDSHFDQLISNSQYSYVLTKYVAEKMVCSAYDRGIPICIHRLGMISGDMSGVSNLSDRINLLIKGCVALGCVPNGDGLSAICPPALTPVSFTVQAITELSQCQNSIGKTYAINNPELMQWQDLLGALDDVGYDMEVLPLEEWKEKVKSAAKCYPDEKIYETLVGLYVDDGADEADPSEDIFGKDPLNHTEHQLMLGELSKKGVDCPAVDRKLLADYLKYLVGCGFVKIPIRYTRGVT